MGFRFDIMIRGKILIFYLSIDISDLIGVEEGRFYFAIS